MGYAFESLVVAVFAQKNRLPVTGEPAESIDEGS
jgi:hypothetical protein